MFAFFKKTNMREKNFDVDESLIREKKKYILENLLSNRCKLLSYYLFTMINIFADIVLFIYKSDKMFKTQSESIDIWLITMFTYQFISLLFITLLNFKYTKFTENNFRDFKFIYIYYILYFSVIPLSGYILICVFYLQYLHIGYIQYCLFKSIFNFSILLLLIIFS